MARTSQTQRGEENTKINQKEPPVSEVEIWQATGEIARARAMFADWSGAAQPIWLNVWAAAETEKA